MNKKTLFIVIGFIILMVIIIGFFIFKNTSNKGNNSVDDNKIVLFYGESCPHCANVDKFIKENKVDEKISFEKKEVYNNKDNAKEFAEKAKKCNISLTKMGVPFLWDGLSSKCISGDVDIINFFKEKINAK